MLLAAYHQALIEFFGLGVEEDGEALCSGFQKDTPRSPSGPQTVAFMHEGSQTL